MITHIIKIFVVVVTLMAFGISAQDSNPNNAINSIKRQPDKYIYAEFTSSSADEALENAKTILKDAIINVLGSSNPDSRDKAEEMMKDAVIIEAKRGSLNRTFVYVIRDSLSVEAATKEETVTLLEASNDNSEEIVKVEETDSPVVEKTVPILENQTSPQNPTPLELEFMDVNKASDIESFVKRAKSKGEISKFGRLKDMPTSGKCYIFIFDKENEIKAYLVKNGNEISNLKNSMPDEIENYKGCGCIWFK